MLDNLQFLEQDEAGRIGRRFEHGVAAVVDRDRLLFLGAEGGEIGRPDQRTGRFETRGKASGQATAVEGFRTLLGNFFERAGEIGLHDRGAETRRPPSARNSAVVRG